MLMLPNTSQDLFATSIQFRKHCILVSVISFFLTVMMAMTRFRSPFTTKLQNCIYMFFIFRGCHCHKVGNSRQGWRKFLAPGTFNDFLNSKMPLNSLQIAAYMCNFFLFSNVPYILQVHTKFQISRMIFYILLIFFQFKMGYK